MGLRKNFIMKKKIKTLLQILFYFRLCNLNNA